MLLLSIRRSILYLGILVAWPLFALTESEVTSALGVTSVVSVSISGEAAGFALSEEAFEGDRSFSLRPYEVGDKYEMKQSVTFRVAAGSVGVLEFYAKQKVNDVVRVSFGTDELEFERYDSVVTDEGWTRYRYYVESYRSEFVLEFFNYDREAAGAKDYALLIDGMSYTSGYQIEADLELGLIELDPMQSEYQLGDVVRARVLVPSGYRASVINNERRSRLRDYNRDTESEEFFVTVDGHRRISANFEPFISFGEIEGWRVGDNYDAPTPEIPEADEEGIYHLKSINIELAEPRSGLLRFEANPPQGSNINLDVRATGNVETRTLFIPEGNADEFEVFELPVDFAAETISIFYHSGDDAAAPKLLPIRNPSFRDPVLVHLQTQGHGEARVSYDLPSDNEKRMATLVAEPAAGWTFIEWTGTIESTQPEITLPITGWETVTALFAESIELPWSTWHFLHDRGESIFQSTEDLDGPLIILLPEDAGSTVRTLIDIKEQGAYSAHVEVYGPGQGQIREFPLQFEDRSYMNFGDATVVSQSPIRLETNMPIGWEGPTSVVSWQREALVPLTLIDPNNTVVATPLPPYEFGDTVTLQVKENALGKFIGWEGDITSTDSRIELTLREPVSLGPAFLERMKAFDTEVRSIGFTLWNISEQEDGSYAFAFDGLPPNEQAKLETDFVGPLVLKVRIPESLLSSLSFSQGASQVPRHQVGGDAADIRYISISSVTTTPLKISVRNNTESPLSGAFEILGLYQKRVGSLALARGDVDVDPELLYYPLGSSVTLSAQPDSKSIFKKWESDSSSSPAIERTIQRSIPFVIDPVFGVNFGSSSIDVTDETFNTWDIYSDRFSKSIYEDESIFLGLKIDAPGVLSFERPNEDASFVVLVDGEEITALPPHLHRDPDSVSYAIDGPSDQIQIALARLSDDPWPLRVDLERISFADGYLVATRREGQDALKIQPSSDANIFREGTTVTLTASEKEGCIFQGWVGDMSSTEPSVTFVVDRHILTEPTYRPSRNAVGLAALSFDEFVNAELEDDSDGITSTITLYPVPSQTRIRFDVPANAEFTTAVQNVDTVVDLLIDGVLTQSVESGSGGFLTAPAQAESRQVTVVVHFTEVSIEPVVLGGLYVRDRFVVIADFGDYNDRIEIVPLKNAYEVGSVVQFSIKEQAGTETPVFYDVLATYPFLSEVDWLTVENKRTFSRTIKSDLFIGGFLGDGIQRGSAEIVTGSNILKTSSSGSGIDGGPATVLSLSGDTADFFRIHAGQSSRVEFFAKIPEGGFLILTDYNDVAEQTVVEGDGEWRQFNLSLPDESDYLNFILGTSTEELISISISDLKVQSGYAPAFIASGAGRIEVDPADRWGAAASLRVVNGENVRIESWGTLSEGREEVIEVTAALSSPAKISLQEYSTVAPGDFGGVEELSGDDAPQLVSTSEHKDGGEALAFGHDRERKFSFQASGPSVLRMYIRAAPQNGSLRLKVDEQEEIPLRNENYNSLSKILIQIPEGSHQYTILGAKGNALATSFVFQIESLPGYIGRIEESLEDRTIMTPVKDAYAKGDVVTVEIAPEAGVELLEWRGGASGSSNPLLFTVPGEFEIGALLVPIATLESNVSWEITRQPTEDLIRATLKGVLVGPGILTMENVWTPLSITANGKRLDSELLGFSTLRVIIPEGEQELLISGENGVSLLGSSIHFRRGFYVQFATTDDRLVLSPRRTLYQKGETVTLDWESAFTPSWKPMVLLNGKPLDRDFPITYTIDSNLQLDAVIVDPKYAGEYYSVSESTVFERSSGRLLDAESVDVALSVGSSETAILGRVFEEGGTLSFSTDDLYWMTDFSLYIDGVEASRIDPLQDVSFRVPPRGARFEWRAKGSGSLRLFDLQFTVEDNLSGFDRFMARKLSSIEYALNSSLGESDDFDRDGFSNFEEYQRGEDPASYSIPILADRDTEGVFAFFHLENEVLDEQVAIEVYDPSQSAWLRYGLADLAFETFPHSSSRRGIKLDLNEVAEFTGLVRVVLTLE